MSVTHTLRIAVQLNKTNTITIKFATEKLAKAYHKKVTQISSSTADGLDCKIEQDGKTVSMKLPKEKVTGIVATGDHDGFYLQMDSKILAKEWTDNFGIWKYVSPKEKMDLYVKRVWKEDELTKALE